MDEIVAAVPYKDYILIFMKSGRIFKMYEYDGKLMYERVSEFRPK